MISLNACLDAPIRPPRSKEDLGVKKRVNDRGVIVGGFRCLLPLCFPGVGRIGEEAGSPPSSDTAVLDGIFSWDPRGVKFSMILIKNTIVIPQSSRAIGSVMQYTAGAEKI